MENKKLSDTYIKLYTHIIADLLFQICDNNHAYCVRYKIGDDILPIAIWKKLEKYESTASENMFGDRLDRHKLASCICGAIIEIKPLQGYNGATIKKNSNETLALYVGLNIIKAFMMYDVLEKIPHEGTRCEICDYLKSKFAIRLPSLNDNICDDQEYSKNIVNALYWSHDRCDITKQECFRYDIWAYSKIFYHLEMYNKEFFNECVQECVRQYPIN